VIHLRMLAKVALLFRDPTTVPTIRSARTKREVLSVLVKADCKLTASF